MNQISSRIGFLSVPPAGSLRPVTPPSPVTQSTHEERQGSGPQVSSGADRDAWTQRGGAGKPLPNLGDPVPARLRAVYAYSAVERLDEQARVRQLLGLDEYA